MAKNEHALAHLSTKEIDAILRALPEVGWIKLRKISYSTARLYPIDAEDLLHEALCRALDGRRCCPRHVDIFKFLGDSMQSIASDTLKSMKRRPELRLVSNSDENDDAFDPPDNRPIIEEELANEQEASRIKDAILYLFEDDPIAQIMAEGTMEDMEGEELRVLTQLDKTAFASKRRLIRRRIEKAFPEGLKP